MLKIVGLAGYDGQIERFSGDQAVPIFNVRVGRAQHPTEPPAVWRVEAPHAHGAGSSVLYIWIRRSDGSIRDLELVAVRKECIEFVEADFEFLGEGECGLPVVDMTLWQHPAVEMGGWGKWPTVSENLCLRLFVGENAYSLQIGDASEVCEVITFDQFRLGLDDAAVLRRIDVVDVKPVKIEAIREWKTRPPSSMPPSGRLG